MKKHIGIIFLSGILLFGSSFLFYRQQSSTTNQALQNWWAVYFEYPKNDQGTFIIENRSQNESFSVAIYLEKNKIRETNVKITNGGSQRFPIKTEELSGKTITVTVTSNNQTKSIDKHIK